MNVCSCWRVCEGGLLHGKVNVHAVPGLNDVDVDRECLWIVTPDNGINYVRHQDLPIKVCQTLYS